MEKRLTQEEIDDLIRWIAQILQEKDELETEEEDIKNAK